MFAKREHQLSASLLLYCLLKWKHILQTSFATTPKLFIGANPSTTPKWGWKVPRRGGKSAEGVIAVTGLSPYSFHIGLSVNKRQVLWRCEKTISTASFTTEPSLRWGGCFDTFSEEKVWLAVRRRRNSPSIHKVSLKKKKRKKKKRIK